MMADNRIAYGLAKKHGIDTHGMTPKQVWDALNEKGIDWQREYKADRDAEADKREAYARKWTADGVPRVKKIYDKKTNVRDTIKSYEGKPEGTYNYNTGEMEILNDGYMVTFHQNEPDENGHYKSHYGRYSDEEYDNLTNQFAIDNDAEVYIGVFDGEPEISFKVKDKKEAIKLMEFFNQDSIWDNRKMEIVKNKNRDKTKNPLRGE